MQRAQLTCNATKASFEAIRRHWRHRESAGTDKEKPSGRHPLLRSKNKLTQSLLRQATLLLWKVELTHSLLRQATLLLWKGGVSTEIVRISYSAAFEGGVSTEIVRISYSAAFESWS